MTAFILDHCVFTRSAMRSLLTDSGVRGNIYTLNDVLKLNTLCHRIIPDIVIISQRYMHAKDNGHILKTLIERLPHTFFLIFIGNENIVYNAVVPLKSNVIVTSKFLAVDGFTQLFRHFAGQERSPIASRAKRCTPLRFSKTEKQILAMWMAGENTKAICAHLNIKDKTLSSHKINIKRKTNADNKLIIYYILQIAGSVTDDLYARQYNG